jgi:hypothetical protein
MRCGRDAREASTGRGGPAKGLQEGAFVGKRTVTTIEIVERIVISAGRADIQRPACPVCADRAMVTPEEAASLARVTVRDIYARIEAESTHFLETPDGLLLLCANSLGEGHSPTR